MKPTLLLSFLLSITISYSQLQPPEAFLSFGGFFEEELDPSVYMNFSLGTELFAFKFFAPELDVTYHFGGVGHEDWEADTTGAIVFRSNMERHFDSWVWGVGTKFFIEDEYNRIVFIPKYHFGNQNATGSYLDSDQLEIRQEVQTKFNFWAFSLGYEFLNTDKIGKVGLYLTYTGFNAGKSLNQLDFDAQGYGKNNFNTKAIGLTVRLSTEFGRRKNPHDS